MNIAIDFDGVLCDPKNIDKGRRMGNPIAGSTEAMITLRKHGHRLIIFTVRGDSPQHVEDWLKYFGIPYDEVTRTKPDDVAFFIDDHAIRFTGDWSSTLDEMHQLHQQYLQSK